MWPFRFGGPTWSACCGRARIYLDPFWNEFSADPRSFGEASREHYDKFSRSLVNAAGFSQFAAFDEDAIDQPFSPMAS